MFSYKTFKNQNVHTNLSSHGFALIDDVAKEEDFLKLVNKIGKLQPQYDGALVWSIKAKISNPNIENYHSLSTGELLPHTECYEFNETPPRYLALWCKNPGKGTGGSTFLGDLRKCIYENLTSKKIKELIDIPVEFKSTPGLLKDGMGTTCSAPLISNGNIIRFSVRCMESKNIIWLDDEKNKIKEWLYANSIETNWHQGLMLIWDNHRMAHWRSGYSDANRELRRVWLR